MAWATKASVSATDRANLALDLPCLVGQNWMRDNATGYPRWTTDGDGTGSDVAETGYESYLGKDDYDDAVTRPDDASPQDIWYYNVDLGSAQGILDVFAILGGHNLYSCVSGGTRVRLQIATADDFTAGVETIYDLNPTTSDKRIVSFDLEESADSNAMQFPDVQYARLVISHQAADGNGWSDTDFQPELTEVWLGQRCQLVSQPVLPFDTGHHLSSSRMSESDSGIINRAKKFSNRRLVDYSYIATDATAISDWLRFCRTDTDGLLEPFLFCEDPSSAPTDAIFMGWDGDSPELVGPTTGQSERRFEMHAREHGKYLIFDGV